MSERASTAIVLPLPECSERLGYVEFFECITQSPDEPAPAEYLEICTVEAELLACSFRCPDECGGHPICRPCFDLAHERGELHPKDTPHSGSTPPGGVA